MRYLAQILILVVALIVGSFVIPAVAQQPVVQWQAVVTTINNIQTQLSQLAAQVNSFSLPSAPNQVYAGPATSGVPLKATFRSLVAADLPVLGGDANGAYGSNTVTKLHMGGQSVSMVASPVQNYFVQFSNGGLVFAIPSGTIPTVPSGSGQLFFNNAGTPAWMASYGALGQLMIGQGPGSPNWVTVTGDLSINALGQTIVSTIQGATPFANCTGNTPFLAAINGTVQGTCASTTVTPQVGALALNTYLTANLPACPGGAPKLETWVSDANAACVTGNAPVGTGGAGTLCKVICNGPSGAGWLEELVSGTGTVTSVAMTGDGVIFASTVPGSPVINAGTLAPSLLTQTAHTVLAGPTSGVPATPTFRVLITGDIPNPGGDVTNTYAATQVSALHFGATQQPLCTSPVKTGDVLGYNGTCLGDTVQSGGGGGGGPNTTAICNLSGPNGGSVVCYQPWQATSDKEVSCLFTNYLNTGSNPQTCTFTVAFSNANSFFFEANSNPPSTASTTAVSLPINQVTAYSGPMWIKGL